MNKFLLSMAVVLALCFAAVPVLASDPGGPFALPVAATATTFEAAGGECTAKAPEVVRCTMRDAGSMYVGTYTQGRMTSMGLAQDTALPEVLITSKYGPPIYREARAGSTFLIFEQAGTRMAVMLYPDRTLYHWVPSG